MNERSSRLTQVVDPQLRERGDVGALVVIGMLAFWGSIGYLAYTVHQAHENDPVPGELTGNFTSQSCVISGTGPETFSPNMTRVQRAIAKGIVKKSQEQLCQTTNLVGTTSIALYKAANSPANTTAYNNGKAYAAAIYDDTIDNYDKKHYSQLIVYPEDSTMVQSDGSSTGTQGDTKLTTTFSQLPDGNPNLNNLESVETASSAGTISIVRHTGPLPNGDVWTVSVAPSTPQSSLARLSTGQESFQTLTQIREQATEIAVLAQDVETLTQPPA